MKRLLLIILIFSHSIYGQNSTIKGVVTYFFNENYGLKPDVGAEVIMIESDYIKEFDNKYKQCDRLALATKEYNLKNSLLLAKSDLDKLSWSAKSKTEKAHKARVDSIKNLISINSDKILISVKCEKLIIEEYKNTNKNYYRASVDGAGNYSIKLPIGKYYIVISSKGREYSVVASIEVLENREIDFSYSFDLVSFTGILYSK